jgi:hypothetical protein
MDGNNHNGGNVRGTEQKSAMRVRTGWSERFSSRFLLTIMVLLWVVFLLSMVWWAMSGGVAVWPVSG